MDRIPKNSLLSQSEGKSDEVLNKQDVSGTTKSGREVKTTDEKKQLPESKEHGPEKLLYQRTRESLTPTENLLQQTDVRDSLVDGTEDKTKCIELENNKQKELEELLILADLDPLLGLKKKSRVTLTSELDEWHDADKKISEGKSEQSNIESYEVTKIKNQEIIEPLVKWHNIPAGIDCLTNALLHQMKQKGISIENVSDEVFKKELNVLLKDMKNRGVGLSSKVTIMSSTETEEAGFDMNKFHYTPASYSDRIESHTLNRLRRYSEIASKLPKYDAKFNEYINSQVCPKWNSEQKLYRGGDVSMERKTLRNIEKNKKPFRKDLINRGLAMFGYGQYYTTKPRTAANFASKELSPVILTTSIKPGTPVVKYKELLEYFEERDGEHLKNSSAESKFENFLDWKEYIEMFSTQPVVVFSDSPQMPTNNHICTLPTSEVIEEVSMSAAGDVPGCYGPEAVTKLSIHRLEDGYIKGRPDKFEVVNIPDTSKLETTDFVALGHSSGQPLQVYEYQMGENRQYVALSPTSNNEYLLVNQLPESLNEKKPTFLVEPSNEYLLQRKKQKSKELQNPETREKLEQKADENLEVIKKYFNYLV